MSQALSSCIDGASRPAYHRPLFLDGAVSALDTNTLIHAVVASLVFALLGIIVFGAAFWVITKVAPFSIRKEIEEDQNTSLGIVIGAVIIGLSDHLFGHQRLIARAMVGSSEVGSPSARVATQSPWLWGRSVDLLVFGGSTLLALLLVPLGPRLSDDGALPGWGFLFFVVCIDVAHVWSTLFRTYLDPRELRRRRRLYAAVPALVLAFGIALHAVSAIWFWRALAYTAVFHFVRQQVGWAAVYRARAGERKRVDKMIDDEAIYASTLYPLFYWHAASPRAFEWFVEGDFLPIPSLLAWLPLVRGIRIAALVAYLIRALQESLRGHKNFGKHLVVAGTAVTWFTGIIASNSDFQFTVANVIVHGAPYFALLYFYLRARVDEGARGLMGMVARGGVAAFFAVAISFAFAEEMIWDRLVWHARPSLFGGSVDAPTLGRFAMAVVVPLLALPQGTHYVLDAVLWRRKDAGPAQGRALGFPGRRTSL